MNGTELARKLKTSTRKVGELIRTGRIKAERVKRAWVVDPYSLAAFQRRNKAALDKIRREYVSLYHQGATVEGLQLRAEADFKQAGIVWPLEGFAEQTIYDDVMGWAHNGR